MTNVPTQPSPQDAVLSMFRGHAMHLNTQSERAAARQEELAGDIARAEAELAELAKQIEKLGADATDLERDLAQMRKEHGEVAAEALARAAQGKYAMAVVALAEKASTTETLTDGQLNASGAAS